MMFDSNNLKDHPDGEPCFTPEFRELLRSCDPAPELMSWNQVRTLVESAPPVHVPWYREFFRSQERQLRFAAGPLLILVLIGGMWVMPAQSLNIGTTVISELPGSWDSESPQFQELNSVSRSDFNSLNLPQASMQLMLMPRDDAQQLVMVLSGVDQTRAQDFYSSLSEQFPVLAAMPVELHPIETKMHDNMLADLSSRLGGLRDVDGLTDNQLSLLVKNVLDESGFTNVKLTVTRSAGGKVQIEVEADLEASGSQSELSIDELRDAGYDSATLGNDAYRILCEELGVVSP